jgi:hypothetical protein
MLGGIKRRAEVRMNILQLIAARVQNPAAASFRRRSWSLRLRPRRVSGGGSLAADSLPHATADCSNTLSSQATREKVLAAIDLTVMAMVPSLASQRALVV